MPKPIRNYKEVAISEVMQSLRRIVKTLQDYSKNVSSKYGVTGPQLWILNTLQHSENLSLGELSEKMYLHPSTISGVIDRLEKKGYVARDRNQKDRRVVKVALTGKGKQLVKKTPNPIQGKMVFGLKKMKKEELMGLCDSIKKLVDIMEAQNVKVTFFFDQE
jgi:DNA-binding MarR family transcriptional regulator